MSEIDIRSRDMLDLCSELNTSEMKLLQFIREEVYLHGTEITPANSPHITDYIRVALKKGYPHLNKLGVLTRVRRGVYRVEEGLFEICKIPYVPATKAILRRVDDYQDIEIVSAHSGDAAAYLESKGLA